MQPHYPQRTGIDKILREAFAYWNNTLFYHILFSLIYFSVAFLVLYYFAAKFGLLEKFVEIFPLLSTDPASFQVKMTEIARTSEAIKFSYVQMGTFAFLYPLNLGLMKMFRKIDLKEEVKTEDLFAGYSGSNFFIFTSFYLFWFIIFSYLKLTVILGVVWVLVTLFSAPLMFFMEKRIFETVQLSYKALKADFITISVCALVALLFKYIGIFTFVGAIFTFPFWNAMIYALYKNLFKEMN